MLHKRVSSEEKSTHELQDENVQPQDSSSVKSCSTFSLSLCIK